jgi:transporter family-2 protein
VAVESGNAVSATWLNFLMGTVMIAVLLAVTHLGRTASSPTDGPAPWLLLGGVVGLVFIALAAWSVPRIGVLMTALLAVAGNLTSSLLLDVLLPTPGSVVNAALLVGVGLAFAAVALGARGRSRT